MNLTKTSWPLGWTPSADMVNGSSEGLLRMDNLQQDEDGILGISRGLKQVNQTNFSDYVSDIYSRIAGSQEWIYAGLNVLGKQVLRSKKGDFSDTVTICEGTNRAIFGQAFNETLVCAGTQRVKDDGITVRPLGLQTAQAPTISAQNQPTIQFGDSDVPAGYDITKTIELTWTNQLGTGFQSLDSAGYQQSADATSLIGVAIGAFTITQDLLNIGNGPAADPNNDLFVCNITPNDSSTIISVQLDFLLNGNPTQQDSIRDYYTYTWYVGDILPGNFQVAPLTVYRGQFTRVGSQGRLHWANVTGVRVSVTTTSVSNYFFTDIFLSGGAAGQLSGQYQWLQVNYYDNGYYRAMSPTLVQNPTVPTTVFNGNVTLTPSVVEDQVNYIEFYRIAVNTTLPGTTAGNINQTDNTAPQSFMNQWYLVANTTPGVPVQDNISDVDAISENVILNQFVVSLQPLTDGNGLQDTIFGMVGIYNERMIYLGQTFIYLGARLNPDGIDNRYILKVSGDPNEKNLWIKQLSNQVLILATSKDLYEITGTLLDQPDGTLDIIINPIGEAYPPLCDEAAQVNGGIFYIAADGLRVTEGSNSTLVSPQLRLLFQDENRAGVPGVAIYTQGQARYSIAVGKTKLYFTLPMVDGSRRFLIYDIEKEIYRLMFTDPLIVYVTKDDRVLLGYNESSSQYTTAGSIFEAEIDGVTGIQDINGNLLTGWQFTFQTVFDANNQPRNRKDTFTLKLIVDTGGAACSVSIAHDQNENDLEWTSLGSFSANGPTTIYIPLNDVTLGFRYALKIVDVSTLEIFKLYEYTIEYEPRPEQLDYMRILPTNLGTVSRKRFTAFAFIIDTLGNNITFTPYVDNVALTDQAVTFNTATKLTFLDYFTREILGTDIGGILSGGVFEFYQINTEECVSEKLPTPCEYLVIPANNYGTPNRKRHTSYKFQILTRGSRVQLTPILDGVSYDTRIFNTATKTTVEYFFDLSNGDVIGIDIGGILQSLDGVPFEFYGVITPQDVEVLPPRLEYFRIPNNNFGIAAKKRVRTLPLVIDTYGQNVTFIPIVDGVLQSNTTTLNSTGKTTLYHYFINDSFGTDYGGILESSGVPPKPFEFYGLGQPENVEILPVPKKFDQIGPISFDKIGKLFGFRTRLIMTGETQNLPYAVYGDNQVSDPTYDANPLFSGSIPVVPGIDGVYEVQFPKNVNTDMVRIAFGPTNDPFHRYTVKIKVQTSGMESDSKWVPIR